MEFELREDERLDDLQAGGLSIIQSDEVFSFSLDAVLLARYVTVRQRDRVIELGRRQRGDAATLDHAEQVAAWGIVGLEIQERLADMARRSVRGNGLEETIKIVHGDTREAVATFGHELVRCGDLQPALPPGGDW